MENDIKISRTQLEIRLKDSDNSNFVIVSDYKVSGFILEYTEFKTGKAVFRNFDTIEYCKAECIEVNV